MPTDTAEEPQPDRKYAVAYTEPPEVEIDLKIVFAQSQFDAGIQYLLGLAGTPCDWRDEIKALKTDEELHTYLLDSESKLAVLEI